MLSAYVRASTCHALTAAFAAPMSSRLAKVISCECDDAFVVLEGESSRSAASIDDPGHAHRGAPRIVLVSARQCVLAFPTSVSLVLSVTIPKPAECIRCCCGGAFVVCATSAGALPRACRGAVVIAQAGASPVVTLATVRGSVSSACASALAVDAFVSTSTASAKAGQQTTRRRVYSWVK